MNKYQIVLREAAKPNTSCTMARLLNFEYTGSYVAQW